MQALEITRTATITTDCTCEDYNEETDTTTPSTSCAGYCGEDSEEWAAELVQEWLDTTTGHDYELVKIEGSGMGWTRASGYKLVKAETTEIARSLYLNGDFTIDFQLTADKLTATRYSHDEPTGASFEFQRVQRCATSYCEETEGLKTNKHGEPLCGFCREVDSVN